NVYLLNKEGYWTFTDLRFIWNTTGLNGKYNVMYKAYRLLIDGTLDEVILPPNDLDHFTIEINSRPVQFRIDNITYADHTPIAECEKIVFPHFGDSNLIFTVTAWHPDGFLGNFRLNCFWGNNRYGGQFVYDQYVGSNDGTPPTWQGVFNHELPPLLPRDSGGQVMDWHTCPYRFYLAGSARITDGVNYLRWGSDNIYQSVVVTGEAPATPTATPAPSTPLPRPTATPTVTPRPTERPLFRVDFNESSMRETGFVYNAAAGSQVAPISVGSVPPGEGTDGRGLIIEAAPGQGTLAIMVAPVPVGSGPVLISISVMADAPGSSAALAALNAPMGVDMGFSQALGPDVPVGEWGQLVLLYDPPDDAIHLGVQVAVPEGAESGVTVFFDNLIVSPLPQLSLLDVSLAMDGSFDGDTSGLVENINGNSGAVAVLPDTEGGNNVLLSIQPENDAANVGIFAGQLQQGFPHLLQASVEAHRLFGSGGVTALVMTNGNGNVGVFLSGDKLPSGNESPATITIGGGFTAENPVFPIISVVQNGSTGTASAIVVDDLTLRRIVGGL
ncbi:MAG: hypothetical protein ABIH23_23880, partial [bacterium]